jgi:hypothetical protein
MPIGFCHWNQSILKGYLRIENLVDGGIVPFFVIRIKKVAIYESSKNCYDSDNLLMGKCPANPPDFLPCPLQGLGPGVGRWDKGA